MNYKKHLSEPWFSLIKLKLKTVEGRLNKGDFTKMKIGDTIIFYNNDFDYREITVKITKTNNYYTFRNYLQKETLKKTLPGFTNLEEGLNVYFKYFTKEQESQHKIKAIHMVIV